MHLLNRRFINQFALAMLLLISLDSMWIYFVASQMYLNHVSSILAAHPGWPPVLGFYMVYSFGLWFLAIKPSIKPSAAALKGAVLGLTAYGTYALTAQALFQGWDWSLTISDSLWGMVLSAIAAFVTVKCFPNQT